MTGLLSPAEAALVQTLAYRQSSLRAGSRAGAGAAGGRPGAAPRAPPRPGNGAPAVHGAPKAVALRTPSHFAAGCGARHRFSPSGGAAKGMPLNTRTAACPAPVAPDRRPVSILTCSGTIAEVRAVTAAMVPAASNSAIRAFLIVFVFIVISMVREREPE